MILFTNISVHGKIRRQKEMRGREFELNNELYLTVRAMIKSPWNTILLYSQTETCNLMESTGVNSKRHCSTKSTTVNFQML